MLTRRPARMRTMEQRFSALRRIATIRIRRRKSAIHFLPKRKRRIYIHCTSAATRTLCRVRIRGNALIIRGLGTPPPGIIAVGKAVVRFRISDTCSLRVILPRHRCGSVIMRGPSKNGMRVSSVATGRVYARLGGKSSIFSGARSSEVGSRVRGNSMIFRRPASSRCSYAIGGKRVGKSIMNECRSCAMGTEIGGNSYVLGSHLSTTGRRTVGLCIRGNQVRIRFGGW